MCHNTICMISLAKQNVHNEPLKKHTEYLHTKSTLIIAPSQLCEQWKSEIMNKCNLTNKKFVYLLNILLQHRLISKSEVPI